MESDRYDYVIELIQAARDEPEARDESEHISRAQKRYSLLHTASEILVLELITHVRDEGDIHLRAK